MISTNNRHFLPRSSRTKLTNSEKTSQQEAKFRLFSFALCSELNEVQSSNYAGDYPAWIDNMVMVFTTASFLATVILMVVEMMGGRKPTRLSRLSQSRRYFLPSGPISLPVILVIMAKGYRINTVFPMSYNGPAILQLVRMSALAFATETESDIKYVFLEASTVSGILHTALYLDSIILPYYTGLDALVSSRFSGECLTCVCRQQVLVVGGRLIFYRGWSVTTAMVAGTMIFRIFSRLATEGKARIMFMKFTMEALSWILITLECVYLLIISPPERTWTRAACFGGVYVLLCLQLLRRFTTSIVAYYNGNLDNAVRW
ncbi:hypothetical protein Cgig2_017342 [Carnegiea gigantea]|uniref:Uncharacterized protein n=1 Tax=Carnegiea gigantea TaxID=171969 RepID=A0A9Q1QCB9_9CARY|nr:hypothetical protein Cgig2_017342 [Carnegiea gigantea]